MLAMIDLILLDVEGMTKTEALANIAKSAKEMGLIDDDQIVLEGFLRREEKSSTAPGNGLALPEAYSKRFNQPFAFILCRTKEPVEFEAKDNKPVRIILASLIKDKNTPGLIKAMAQLAGLLRNEKFREAFLKTKDENEVRLLLEVNQR